MGGDIRLRWQEMTTEQMREQVEFYRNKHERAKSIKSPYHWMYRAALAELRRRNNERFRRLTRLR